MAWIELHQSVVTHRKTLGLADTLDIRPVEALGHVASLWLWLVDNAPDGSLAGISDKTLARAAQWDGDAAAFREALIEAGLVHDDGDVHDWHDYAGKLIERRQENAERMRDARRARAETPTTNRKERAAHVQRTSTARAGATEQNSTQQNRTESSAPNGAGVPAEPETRPAKRQSQDVVTPSPKPNKSGELIDLIEAQSIPLAMTAADHSALKRAPLTAAQVAEVYVAIASGEYGDDWAQERLSVQNAIKAWAAYENRKTAPRPTPRTNGRVHAGADAVLEAFRQQAEEGGLDGTGTFTGRREMGSGEILPRLPG